MKMLNYFRNFRELTSYFCMTFSFSYIYNLNILINMIEIILRVKNVLCSIYFLYKQNNLINTVIWRKGWEVTKGCHTNDNRMARWAYKQFVENYCRQPILFILARYAYSVL